MLSPVMHASRAQDEMTALLLHCHLDMVPSVCVVQCDLPSEMVLYDACPQAVLVLRRVIARVIASGCTGPRGHGGCEAAAVETQPVEAEASNQRLADENDLRKIMVQMESFIRFRANFVRDAPRVRYFHFPH
jgi:hypothetical protein